MLEINNPDPANMPEKDNMTFYGSDVNIYRIFNQ